MDDFSMRYCMCIDMESGLLYICMMIFYGFPCIFIPLLVHRWEESRRRTSSPGKGRKSTGDSWRADDDVAAAGALFAAGKKKDAGLSESERARREIYARQDENLATLEDMQQMHNADPDADLEAHFGWEHKVDYDSDGVEESW